MAAVVAFVSQKGGVGKSTLARALAREAAAGELRVKIADLDTQQGTSVDWHRARLGISIEPIVSVEAFKTASQALAAADGFDLLIIDGPARTSKATLEIARSSSLVVQPPAHPWTISGLPSANTMPLLRRVSRLDGSFLRSTALELRLKKMTRGRI
ncbi:hypothetical protein NVSP9465_04385 [Novosphingobium sp. CECT 9465]|nr:hypothetical protein NVSP9465_04385 [Novosphingobium sp. CECT 9465]